MTCTLLRNSEYRAVLSVLADHVPAARGWCSPGGTSRRC
jgi:hypothetical protein